jgi:hypothetical protein
MESIGEVTSIGGLIFKLVKLVIIFSAVFGVILFEAHFLGFGITNLFVDKYNFQLEDMKSDYVAHGYNNFLYYFSKIAVKMPILANLAVILVVPSLVYVSFFHSKRKGFPGAVIGTVINNTLIFVIIALLVQLIGKLIGSYSLMLYFMPIFYAIYLIKFNGKFRNNKLDKFIVIKKSEKENAFVFETNKGQIYLDNPYRGIYIQGGAGSGKSASIFEPIIKQIGEMSFTGMLYDFKSPELTSKIYTSFENSFIKVRNVNFKNPLLSERVNPIHPKYLIKSVVAIEYAQVLINNLIPETIKKNDFWTSNAKMILASVIWFLRNSHPDKCTIPHVISLILHNPADELVNKVSMDYEAGGMIASLKESIDRGSEKTVAGMLSTLQNALSNLNSQDVFWILSKDDVDLDLNNPGNPSFLCIGNDSTLPEVYRPAISLIMTVALRQMNRPEQLKSVVMVDEAPTVFIPNIEQIPATARSNKIATIFGVQDYSQLQDKYGEDKAQVLVSNLGSHFYGRIVNPKSAEMVQKLFSKEDRTFISKSDGTGTSGKLMHLNSNTNKGTSESVQERDRVKVNELIHLESGEFYGIVAEGSPREFLKTKFEYSPIPNNYINTRIPVNEEIIKENYFRIVNECKEIFD